MVEVVINTCYGGFCLSDKAVKRYAELKGIDANELLTPEEELGVFDNKDFNLYAGEIERDDPTLVQAVKELGEEADGKFAKLKVVDIPDDVEWYIDEYDGKEWVAEKHRIWR